MEITGEHIAGAIQGTSNAIRDWKNDKTESRWNNVLSHAAELVTAARDVHKDYVDGFEEIRALINRDAAPTQKVADFLESRRKAKLLERDSLNTFALTIKEHLTDDSSEKENLINLAEAIINYLRRSSGLFNISWFRDFQNHLNNVVLASNADVEINLDPAWEPECISGPVKFELQRQLNFLLETDLRLAFAPVEAAYRKLTISNI